LLVSSIAEESFLESASLSVAGFENRNQMATRNMRQPITNTGTCQDIFLGFWFSGNLITSAKSCIALAWIVPLFLDILPPMWAFGIISKDSQAHLV